MPISNPEPGRSGGSCLDGGAYLDVNLYLDIEAYLAEDPEAKSTNAAGNCAPLALED